MKKENENLDKKKEMMEIGIEKPRTKLVLDMKLYDYIPQNKIKALLTEPKIEIPEEQKSLLLKYHEQMKDTDFHFTKYKTLNNSRYGRIYPHNGMGTIAFKKNIRNFLMKDDYYDLDIKMCHISILLSLMESIKEYDPQNYKCIKEYFENKEMYWEIMRDIFPDEEPKQMMNSLLYGGNKTIAKSEPKLLEFMTEVDLINKYLRNENKVLYDFARRKKGGNNSEGSFLSYYLQEHEYRIIEKIMFWLYYENPEMILMGNKKVMSYEYDGIKLLKENVKDINGLLLQMNEMIQKDYPYVEFVNKEMKTNIDINVSERAEEYDKWSYLSDEKVVDIIEEEEGDNLIYSTETKEWFFFDGTRWTRMKGVCHPIKRDLRKIVLRNLEKKIPQNETVLWKKIKEGIDGLELNKYLESAMSLAKSRFHRTGKLDFFDAKQHLLGFENGVYDLNTDTFRNYEYNDFVTMSVGYDYFIPDEESIAELEKVLRKIYVDEKEYRMNMIIRASTLSGMPVEKFFVMNGKGRNGKGVTKKLNLSSLGDYGMEADRTILTDATPKSGINVTVAECHLKRYVNVPEPREEDKFDNAQVKQLTGGDDIKARKCNSNDNTVKNHMTLMVEMNRRVYFKSKPETAEVERLVDVYHRSSFESKNTTDDYENLTFVPDVNCKTNDFMTRMRMPFMYLLMKYYKIYRENNYQFELTQEVVERTRDYILECHPIHLLFTEVVRESEGNHKLDIRALYHKIKECPQKDALERHELRKLSQHYLIDYLTARGIEIHYEKQQSYIKGFEFKTDYCDFYSSKSSDTEVPHWAQEDSDSDTD